MSYDDDVQYRTPEISGINIHHVRGLRAERAGSPGAEWLWLHFEGQGTDAYGPAMTIAVHFEGVSGVRLAQLAQAINSVGAEPPHIQQLELADE